MSLASMLSTPAAPIPASNFTAAPRTLSDMIGGRSTIVQNPDSSYQPYLDAIASVETQGVNNPYSSKQYSGSPALGDALGKYRVTEGELKSYGPQIMGRPVNSQEFASNPAAQDAYMVNKVKLLQKAGLTPAGIIGVHNQGMTGYATPGVAMQKAHAADANSNGYTGRAMKVFLAAGGK